MYKNTLDYSIKELGDEEELNRAIREMRERETNIISILGESCNYRKAPGENR